MKLPIAIFALLFCTTNQVGAATWVEAPEQIGNSPLQYYDRDTLLAKTDGLSRLRIRVAPSDIMPNGQRATFIANCSTREVAYQWDDSPQQALFFRATRGVSEQAMEDALLKLMCKNWYEFWK